MKSVFDDIQSLTAKKSQSREDILAFIEEREGALMKLDPKIDARVLYFQDEREKKYLCWKVPELSGGLYHRRFVVVSHLFPDSFSQFGHFIPSVEEV